ncbi:MAG TPA: hypothetical protein VFM11_13410 [Burkholderiales bacterium]|nr:hypothetical protein [Burkholderiales bacterium]
MNTRKADSRKGAKAQRARKGKIEKEILCGSSLRLCAFAVQIFVLPTSVSPRRCG